MPKKAASGTPAFEDAMKRLEEIVDKLEGGSVPLEEALALYEEGVKISKECLETLNKAELRLKFLMKDVDGTFNESDEIDPGVDDDDSETGDTLRPRTRS